MAYEAPGVRTYVHFKVRSASSVIPYMIPCVIGKGDTVFKHTVKLGLEMPSEDAGHDSKYTYLPSTSAISVETVGNAAGMSHYIQGIDFVFHAPSLIEWLPDGSSPEPGDEFYISYTAEEPVAGDYPVINNLLLTRGNQKVGETNVVESAAMEAMTTVPSPIPVSDFAYAGSNKEFYIFGGKLSSGAATNKFYKIYPVTAAWVEIDATNTPSARFGSSGVWVGGKFYIFGGFQDTAPVNELHVWDPTTNAWTELTPTGSASVTARYDATVCPFGDDSILITGGVDDTGAYLADAFVYDISDNEYSDISAVADPYPGFSGGYLSVDPRTPNTFLLFGGQTGVSTCSNVLYKLTYTDSSTPLTVATVTVTDAPDARTKALAATFSDGIWIFGGKNTGSMFNDLWKFDFSEGDFKELTPVVRASSRHSGAMVSINDCGYLFGGVTASGLSNDTWKLISNDTDVTTYTVTNSDMLPWETVLEVLAVTSEDGMTIYTEDVDYTFADHNTIVWLSDATRPESGDGFRVTLQIASPENTDTDPYALTLVSDTNQIEQMFGSETCQDGSLNELQLAGRIAIEAGAPLLYMKQVRPTGPGKTIIPSVDFKTALESLELVEDIWSLVPLTDDATTIGAVINHCNIQSSVEERKERVCFITKDTMGTVEEVRGFVKAINNMRVSLVYPNVNTRVLQNGKKAFLGGQYICAALAGLEARGPEYVSLTNLQVLGIFDRIYGIPNLRRPQLDYLASAGVLICTQEQEGYPIEIRHQLTTCMNSVTEQERSVVRIADLTAKYLRASCKNYIGGTNIANDIELHTKLRATLVAAISFLVSKKILQGGTVNEIWNPDYAPDEVIANIDIEPSFPCNRIRLHLYL